MKIPRAAVFALAVAANVAADSALHEKPEPLTMEVSGCRVLMRGPVCELPLDRALHVWVRAGEEERVSALADNRPLSIEPKAIDGGRAMRVEIPLGTSRFTIRARGPKGARSNGILVASSQIEPAIEAADALRKQGQIDAARAILAIPSVSPDRGTRALAKALLARIALSRGETNVGLLMLREAAEESHAAGRSSDEFAARSARAYMLMLRERRFVEAREELASLRHLDQTFVEGRAGALYYEGLLANETGDVRTALGLLRESERVASRGHVPSFHRAALQIEADVLQVVGREREGEDKLREVERALDPKAPPCEHAELLNNVGWFGIQARRARSAREVKSVLEVALRLYEEGRCTKSWGRRNVLTNLALATFDEGDIEGAKAWLAKARDADRGHVDARTAVWWSEVEGRIALALGKLDDALAAYDQLAAIADAGLLPAARWRAALGRARALEALGRHLDAGAAYDDASAKIADQSLLVPLGEGRESFLRRFDDVGRHHVAFLMKRDPKRACEVARRSRARTLAALRWADRIAALGADARRRWDEALAAYRSAREAIAAETREDWTLPEAALQSKLASRREREAMIASAFEGALTLLGDGGCGGGAACGASLGDAGVLRGPEPGEVVLVYYPIFEGAGAPKLAACAMTQGAFDARVLDEPRPDADREELARTLLSPFAGEIAPATQIRVIAAGALEGVDIHALPFRGDPLVVHAPVVFGLDRLSPPRSRPPSPRRAIVIADPRGDLPSARREADRIITEMPWQVTLLEGRAATLGAVRDAIEAPGVALLHYAGHGKYGGLDGWESRMQLAEGASLGVGDVLASRTAPEIVVLSGCETAKVEPGGAPLGLGLGQAFVIAGADVVVAATRLVDDREAERLMSAFYASKAPSAAARLRDAQALVARRGGADWAAFRVLVP